MEAGAVYGLIERVLKPHQYRRLKKGQKGIVRSFLAKVTALSRAQVTRLIQRWVETRRIGRKPAQRPNVPRRYTAADIATLAEVDAAHEDLSGPAVRHLCWRGWEVFADKRFQRLAAISASHIYNLSKSRTYRKIRVSVQHTQARQVSIGERRQPDPKGQAGYLRVDTVHQGQHDGQPGVYHINAVDTVTQCGGVHQIARLPHHRQRFGGRQERSGGRQTDRLWSDRGRTCPSAATALYGLLQPIFELSPSLRIRDGGDQCARQAETNLSPQGLSDALGEADVAARVGEILEGSNHRQHAAAASRRQERHRGSTADAKS